MFKQEDEFSEKSGNLSNSFMVPEELNHSIKEKNGFVVAF